MAGKERLVNKLLPKEWPSGLSTLQTTLQALCCPRHNQEKGRKYSLGIFHDPKNTPDAVASQAAAAICQAQSGCTAQTPWLWGQWGMAGFSQENTAAAWRI